MTAYSSSNEYNQDFVRYDGGVNVNVAPAVIAGTSTVPSVTVVEGVGVTVAAGVIAATATTPAVTVQIVAIVQVDTIVGAATLPAVTVTEGTGVAVNVATVSSSGLIPDPTITEGAGVAVAPAVVAATVTVPDLTITEGTGVSVAPSQIDGSSTVPSLDLSMRFVPTTENILPQIDVVPYHTNDPARRLARFRTPGERGRNIFILTSGAVTTRQPGDPTLISRTLLGGHESPTDLTSDELNALVSAGFTVEVR